MKARTVAIFGCQLSMAAVGARLREKPGIRVRPVQEPTPEALGALEASPPDVILFDLAAAQPSFAVPFLRHHPATVLIGVDLRNDKMLVLSGEPSTFLTADDLVRVIERGVPKAGPGEGHGPAKRLQKS